ncbi:MAG: MBL fold metallo-hydrolase [Bacilli bacterium]|nr:MBL fold metallo-hydrolase [Bacilli bacterium]
MLNVLCVVNGYLMENCYIIHNNKYALIVDPGSESNRIINEIEKNKLKVVGILITHYHFDHIGALDELENKYKCVVVDYRNKVNKIKCFEYEVIENYGHTMDSVSYLFKENKMLFCGDFVFKDTIGDYDDINEDYMFESLERFKALDKDIIVYPGHGVSTTVGYEIKHNPYLRGY